MTTTIEAPTSTLPVFTGPGVYADLPAEVYHGQFVPGDSLSSTGARKLLAPSCPALFKYDQDHGQAHKKEFDLGHAAHKLVLGEGAHIEVIDAPDWKSKAAREERDAAHAEDLVPLLAKDYTKVEVMADAIRRHPLAGPLFTPGTGVAEQSLFWQDQRTGIWRRARPDWVKNGGPRTICVDYKTTADASLDALERAIYTYGYNMQGPWYLDGLRALGLADENAQFIFVFQEKTAPYLITVVGLDPTALQIGAAKNCRAIDTYRECIETGHWPAYLDDIAYLSLPIWAEKNDTEEYL